MKHLNQIIPSGLNFSSPEADFPSFFPKFAKPLNCQADMPTIDHNLILGIDLGGTNTVFGIVDSVGKILCRSSISTTGHPTVKDFISSLRNSVEESMNFGGIAGSFRLMKDSLLKTFNENLLWVYESQVDFLRSPI